MNDPVHAIEAEHISLRYGQHIALDNVSFAIPDGSYVGIVGPNGSGKTSLLRVILGLVKANEGTVHIMGKTPEQARRTGVVGYVPQRIAHTDLPFPATVAEVVATGRTPIIGIGRLRSPHDRDAIQHAMRIAGVKNLEHRLISTLSGGERQKVFVARSLCGEPKILLLDEPTTGVDPAAREQFYGLLRKLNTEHGMTILLVSHDIEMATHEVSFVLALNQKLICHCSSHEFLSEDTLKRLYGRDVELQHAHCH